MPHAGRPIAHRRRAQHTPRAWREGTAASATAPATARGGEQRAARREQQRRSRASARLIAAPATSVPSKPRPGIRKKPAHTEPAIDPTRVRGVHARARGTRVVALAREHAHRERERRADAQRCGEQRDHAGGDVGSRAARTPRSCDAVGERGHRGSRAAKAAIEQAGDPELRHAKPSADAARASWRAATRPPRRSRCRRESSRASSRRPACRCRRRARSAAPRAPRR